ncbi:MAG: Pvc16 family protein [Rubrivivax sp.]|nr:Pvc16 family protein [Rubrivivax sp.]MDP3224516.1 Pvc16 family protein [Rubrivivax sp.]MDP3614927.1 Pvc16 family protein [Rubrivivax sp.]
MIDAALRFLAEETNAFLLRRTGSDLGAVVVGPIVNAAGALQHASNEMRLTLFAADEERTTREQLPQRSIVAGREVLLPPPLKLNLTLLFTASFQQYDQGLRHLSQVLKFMAARPVFTAADSPGLPDGLERLAVDLIAHGPEQLNQIWACIGARHMPHLIYRARAVLLQDTEPVGSGAPIIEIHQDVHGHEPRVSTP